MKNYCKVNEQMIGYIKENFELKKKLEDMIFEMSKFKFQLKIIQLIFLRLIVII